MQRLFNEAGIQVVQTPLWAPNANAYAERFVRSIKEECLDRMIPLGERLSDERSPNSSTTIIMSGIIKDWATTLSTGLIDGGPTDGFGDVHGLAAY